MVLQILHGVFVCASPSGPVTPLRGTVDGGAPPLARRLRLLRRRRQRAGHGRGARRAKQSRALAGWNSRGRFAAFTSIMASESIRREAPGNYQASRHMHANRDGHIPQESGKWLGASIRQIGPGLALSRGGEGGRTAVCHVSDASYGRSRRDLGSQVCLEAAVGEFRARAGWGRRRGASWGVPEASGVVWGQILYVNGRFWPILAPRSPPR